MIYLSTQSHFKLSFLVLSNNIVDTIKSITVGEVDASFNKYIIGHMTPNSNESISNDMCHVMH